MRACVPCRSDPRETEVPGKVEVGIKWGHNTAPKTTPSSLHSRPAHPGAVTSSGAGGVGAGLWSLGKVH